MLLILSCIFICCLTFVRRSLKNEDIEMRMKREMDARNEKIRQWTEKLTKRQDELVRREKELKERESKLNTEYSKN